MFGQMQRSEPELIKPRCKFSDLTYPEKIKAQIDELVEEEPFVDALREEGLYPKRKILLYGPSGCGKTSIAHAIASEFSLPLLEATGGQMQSAYVGEAEKNIANAIKKAEQTKCVMLMDEFDSLAMERTSGNRFATSVVNTLLTSLEAGQMEGFFVACTNHLAHIDPALLRRFDLVLEIPMPTKEILLLVAEKIINGRYGINPKDCLPGNHTPATVERKAKDLLRLEVIKQEKINPRPKKPKPQIQQTKLTGSNNDHETTLSDRMRVPTEPTSEQSIHHFSGLVAWLPNQPFPPLSDNHQLRTLQETIIEGSRRAEGAINEMGRSRFTGLSTANRRAGALASIMNNTFPNQHDRDTGRRR